MSAIRHERIYPHPPEAVWRGLTDPALIERWLLPNDFRAEPGAGFSFKAEPFGGWDGTVACQILELDPPRRLAYSWTNNMIDTIVRFTLTPRDGGTHLLFEQDGFRGFKGAMAKMFMAGGWKKMLAALGEVVPA